jgi:hypothetical protein
MDNSKNTIISYCLFSSKKNSSEIRNWDLHNGENRYWYNIPAIVCVNLFMFPQAEMHIYYSSDLKDHFLFNFLIQLENKITQFKLIEISDEYENTEFTLFRFYPLFEKTCDILFCRDLDSVPNEDEIIAGKFFISFEQFLTQNIRSHTNHKYPITKILAGLCGFRPKKIDFIKEINFKDFYESNSSSEYGIDQKSIIEIFTKQKDWLKKYFVDLRIITKLHDPKKPLIKCKSYKISELKKSKFVNTNEKHFLQHLNKLTSWAGEPIDSRGIWLIKCLIFAEENGKEILDLIKTNEIWQEFYFITKNETIAS